ncbi:DUF948 domain-containing protein [Sporosarcina ureilytica]|uniref:General stress protein n=1 Tax=Sporosarcina ureilytica TaxID=298596 RepID=A0A1D8JG49_9BACL|nr:DUF948 domain-containing protein [Sporosarcina ureilytica]AOV07672.1 hypothetical protein BI350_09085 [Sporosarcina ureilytica]
MDWLGIGVLIIGIALLILVLVLIKPLLKLATLLDSARQTTDRLPKTLDDGAAQAHDIFQQVNKTLENVNRQMNTVHPLFQVIGDAGEASRQVSLQWLNKTAELKENATEAQTVSNRKKYEGLYSVLSFVFYLSQKSGELKKVSKQLKR